MAVDDAYVSWLSHTSTNTDFFLNQPTTFLTCFFRSEGENTPERKVASTRDRTHDHQVMSPTSSTLSHGMRGGGGGGGGAAGASHGQIPLCVLHLILSSENVLIFSQVKIFYALIVKKRQPREKHG